MTGWILGLNTYHADSSACLVRDGQVVVAVEEERLTRVKHCAGLPVRAVAACLEAAGIGLEQIAHVATNRDPRARFGAKLAYALRRLPDPRLILDRLRNKQAWQGVPQALAAAFPGQEWRAKLHAVEHHRAHLASAFYPSPFDAALAVAIDGFGDFASAAWGRGEGAGLEVEGAVTFPHSLGLFYQAITQYLGFRSYGDEYKVMGLAAHGSADADLAEALGRLVVAAPGGGFRLALDYFRHHREAVEYRWNGGTPHVGPLYAPAMERLLGPARRDGAPLTQRHADIARAAQMVFEERVFALLDALRRRTGARVLALAGGCAQNSLAAGRIAERAGFDRVWIPPAATDAGGAVGAALAVWHGLAGRRTEWRMADGLLGPVPASEAVAAVAEPHGAARHERADLARAVAERLAAGAVVGLFDGPMEWGPRALGARSILADPRHPTMRERLNQVVKRREPFRPFAPAVLAEHAADWFCPGHPDALDSPFMNKVVPVRPERRTTIPAVTHGDGTARLQSVGPGHPTLLRPILEHFLALTGVPMVINTSFNENEPIVATPAEAVDCFLRTRMDALAMPPFLVERR